MTERIVSELIVIWAALPNVETQSNAENASGREKTPPHLPDGFLVLDSTDMQLPRVQITVYLRCQAGHR